LIRIERVTLREILLPLTEPFRTAKGLIEGRRIILLELLDASGLTTWSECVAGAAPDYSVETVDSAWDILFRSMIPKVLGKPFRHPRDVNALLTSDSQGSPMARAAVEMGAWAVAASNEGKSLAAFLAQSCAAGSDPRKSVEVGIVLGAVADSDALVSRARDAIARGYRRVKLKISPQSDIDSVHAVSETGGAAMAVDANGSFWLDEPAHVALLRKLDALGLSMIEQPLAAGAMVEHAQLQKILATSICLDESISNEAAVDTMIDLQSARIVNLKPGRVGGFSEAIAIHDRCARAEIPVWCGGMLETGIGRAYNIALASLANFTLPGDLSPSATYWKRDITTSPSAMSADGLLRVPLDRAGPGVDVDIALIDDLTVREALFTA
jgi:o-succinylbenzoate synthase